MPGRDVAQEDLFGNPVDPAPSDQTNGPALAPVNDMDLVHQVLADVADEKAAPLHLDDTGRVRRCARPAPEPVTDDLAAAVTQLMTAQYLTTRRRSCPGHGQLVIATPAGRSAACRWRAYRRPTTWGAGEGAR
jgi:hypothetical protein